MNAFDKILIANRGEIACRIIRTANAMGYETVAVFSDADAGAQHVQMAGEAVHLGASPPAESYLNISAILDAARKTSAHAIHPGYGFLAENADFADACAAAGMVFIGPSGDVIRALGDKARAKSIAVAAGVPCVPGYMGENQSNACLQSEGSKLGFPLLIKAVGGGGGRGIRAVADAAGLEGELEAARREAIAAFGDGRLMLEKLIENARHVEVQVFGDAHGNIVHLFERDCTTQRRRQKIIEEAPSPALTQEQRERVTSYAVALTSRAGYRNAGTVEFIADRSGNIYFIEVNTRLQVEHPVTEMLTGLDLVEWQLRVAAGEPLPLAQKEITRTGHAIEVRLCAEDPASGFSPQTGDVIFWRPETATAVRIDSGIAQGDSISPYYDSMLAKVIAHGSNRPEAIRKLRSALKSTPLLGLPTNQAFLWRLLEAPEFTEASLSTASLDSWHQPEREIFKNGRPSPDTITLAASLFANGSKMPLSIDLICEGEEWAVRYRPGANGASILESGGSSREVTIEGGPLPNIVYRANGIRGRAIAVFTDDATLHLSHDGECFTFREKAAAGRSGDCDTDNFVRAPVAGRVAKVFVQQGGRVNAGSAVAIIEAMKMEIRVTSPADGIITSLLASDGSQIARDGIICEIEKVECNG